MNQTITFDKKAIRKAKRRMKIKKAKDWARNNKELSVASAPIAFSAAKSVCKFAARNATLSREKTMKDCYCYDRSLGHYWALKRKLTNKEWLEIDKRKKNGERLADILEEFRVLK